MESITKIPTFYFVGKNHTVYPLMWTPSHWSICSKSCGSGKQFRHLKCMMKVSNKNAYQEIQSSFCRSAKIKKPKRIRSCGLMNCPTWIKSPWAPCPTAECKSRKTGKFYKDILKGWSSTVLVQGLRIRAVHCILDKRSIVNDSYCDPSERPGDSQPCHNEECIGVWVLGEWSQVSHTIYDPLLNYLYSVL